MIFVTQNLACCTLENESNNTCEYQPDELDINLIEEAATRGVL